MSLRYTPISSSSIQSSNNDSRSLNYIDKFKIKRHVESGLNSLKRNLKRQQQMHNESLSQMFSYIIGDDLSDQTESLDFSVTQQSTKEEAQASFGDSNILNILSSSNDGGSVLNFYKRGSRSFSRSNHMDNTVISNNGTQPGVSLEDDSSALTSRKTTLTQAIENQLLQNSNRSMRNVLEERETNRDYGMVFSQNKAQKEEVQEVKKVSNKPKMNPHEAGIRLFSEIQHSEVENSSTSFVDMGEGLTTFIMETNSLQQRETNRSKPKGVWSQSVSAHASPTNAENISTVRREIDNKENLENMNPDFVAASILSTKRKKLTGSSSAKKVKGRPELQQERGRKLDHISTPRRELIVQIEETNTPKFIKGQNNNSMRVERKSDSVPANQQKQSQPEINKVPKEVAHKVAKEKIFIDSAVLGNVPSQLNDIKPEHLVKRFAQKRLYKKEQSPERVHVSELSTQREDLVEWHKLKPSNIEQEYKYSFSEAGSILKSIHNTPQVKISVPPVLEEKQTNFNLRSASKENDNANILKSIQNTPQVKASEPLVLEEKQTKLRSSSKENDRESILKSIHATPQAKTSERLILEEKETSLRSASKENENKTIANFLVSKLKDLHSDLLTKRTHSQKNSEDTQFFDKVTKLGEKIGSSPLMSPCDSKNTSQILSSYNSEIRESPRTARTTPNSALKDITVRLANNGVDLKSSQLIDRVLELPQQKNEPKKKALSFGVKLKLLAKFVKLLISMTGLQESFIEIREFSKQQPTLKKKNIEEVKPVEPLTYYFNRSASKELRRSSKEESKTLGFASFSNPVPEPTTINIMSPDHLEEPKNEANSPTFSTKNWPTSFSHYIEEPKKEIKESEVVKKEINHKILYGVVRFEGTILRLLRRPFRFVFDKLKEESYELEENILTIESPEKKMVASPEAFGWKNLSLRKAKLSVSRELSQDLMQVPETETKPVEQIVNETPLRTEQEGVETKVVRTLRKQASNYKEGEEADEYGGLMTSKGNNVLPQDSNKKFELGLVEKIMDNNNNPVPQEENWMNTEEGMKKIMNYVLQRPDIRDELKISLNFSTIGNEEDPNRLDTWKQAVEQSLESTLERKLETKLMSLLEERLDSKGYYTHRGEGMTQRELHTEEPDSEIRFHSFVSKNKKDIHRSANLTASRPFFNTSELRHSFIEYKENDMDGSMQKFYPLNEASIREMEDSEDYMDDHHNKPNCLDDVLYIYENSVQKEDDLHGLQPSNPMAQDAETPSLGKRFRRSEKVIISSFADVLNDNRKSSILKDLDVDQNERLSKDYSGVYRLPAKLSRNVHYFYILDGLLTRKVKQRLFEGFKVLKDHNKPLQSRVSPHRPFKLNPFSASNRERYQEIFAQSINMGEITERSSEAYPTSVSFSTTCRQVMRNILDLMGKLDRIKLRQAFNNLKEYEQLSPKQELTFQKSSSVSTIANETTIQNTFWLINMIQKRQWKDLKWGFSQLHGQVLYQRELQLRCRVLALKLEETFTKSLRQTFTKICYHQSENKEILMFQRSTALTKTLQISEKYTKKMSLRDWKCHSSRLAMIDRKLSRVSQILQQEKYKLLSNSLSRIAEYTHIKKEYALYIVNLASVLKDVRQSKLKLAFFHIKQKSQAVYVSQIEKRNSLRRVLNHRIMRDYVELKNFMWKWKIASLKVEKKKSQWTHLSKEKSYLGRCLFNLLKRGLQNEKESAFVSLKDFVAKSKKIDQFSELLNEIKLRNLEYGLDGLKENSELVGHNQEIKKSLQKVFDTLSRKKTRNLMSFLSQIKKLQTTAKKIERHEKAAKLESVIANITRNNLHKGLRMIEFAFISKKNRENFYINLALKTGLLLKGIHNELKREFFDNMKMHYQHEVEFKRFLTNVIARKHIKSLSYFFNKFKTRLIVLKANKSTLRLVEKNIALGVDKLSKVRKDNITHFFNNLRLLKPKQTEQVKHFRQPPVVSVQFPSLMPRRLSKFELTKKIFGMISVLKKICLKQEAIGFRLILAQVSHQDPRDFTPPSERQLTPISQCQISFSIDTLDKSLKNELERGGSQEFYGSLDSLEDHPMAQYILEKEEKIAKRRMKKYFTDWRLTYIKTSNKKNKLICGFNKIWNMFKRDRIQSLWWSFNVLKQSFTDKPQKLNLVYVPYSSGVKFSAGKNTSGHTRIQSHSPIPYDAGQSRNTLRSNRSPPTHQRNNTYSISPAPVSGRRNNNPSISPAPENRARHSNRSPVGKGSNTSHSQRPTVRTSANSSQSHNQTPDKLLHMQPVYSIVGKKDH